MHREFTPIPGKRKVILQERRRAAAQHVFVNVTYHAEQAQDDLAGDCGILSAWIAAVIMVRRGRAGPSRHSRRLLARD